MLSNGNIFCAIISIKSLPVVTQFQLIFYNDRGDCHCPLINPFIAITEHEQDLNLFITAPPFVQASNTIDRRNVDYKIRNDEVLWLFKVSNTYSKNTITDGWQYLAQNRGASRGNTELILGLHPANQRRRYKVTSSLIGWAQT